MTASRTTRFALFLIVGMAFSGARVCAAPDPAVGKTPIHRHTAEPATSADLQPTSTGGTTLIFLGVLLAAAILIRRLVQQQRHRRTAVSPDSIKLLSRQRLDDELTVRLLQVGPRVLIVGTSPQGLTTLAELTDPEEIALLTGETTPASELFSGQSSLERTTMGRSPRPSTRRTSHIVTPTPAGG